MSFKLSANGSYTVRVTDWHKKSLEYHHINTSLLFADCNNNKKKKEGR